MRDERTQGVILRTRLLTESSLIVHWLSADVGRLATVAKGALRPKSPFRGKLDLFYLADFSFRRSRRSELHTLCEVGLRDTHVALRQNLAFLQQAAYCAALIEQTTEMDTPLPEIFTMMVELLGQLREDRSGPLTVPAFEIKLLKELGQLPSLPAARLSAGATRILERLVELDWPGLTCLKASAPQLQEIRQFLRRALIEHLGKIPPGRTAALATE